MLSLASRALRNFYAFVILRELYRNVIVCAFYDLKLRELTIHSIYISHPLRYFILECNFTNPTRNIPQSIPVDLAEITTSLNVSIGTRVTHCYNENLTQDLANLVSQVVGSSAF